MMYTDIGEWWQRSAARAAALAVTVGAVLVLTGCAQQQDNHGARASPDPHPVISQYPTVADYDTLRSARAQVHQALAERDWRRQQFAAYLGLMVLMTMHPVKPGECLDYISRTYSELLSLHDNYRGEDWTPLVAIVRHDPPVTICRAPRHPKVSMSA